MKHLFGSLATVFVALLTFASCQSNANLELESLSFYEKEAMNEVTRSVQNGVESYWNSLEPINWAKLNSLEERFKYFDLPEPTINSLSDEALFQLIVKYPLNYLILAYNDPFGAINIVYDNCNIHKGFVKREEAASLLSNYLLNHHCTAKTTIPTNEYSFVDELFLEYFISSGLIDFSKEAETLKLAVNEKKGRYAADQSMNSNLTLNALEMIETRLFPTISTLSTSSSTNNVTIYTPTFQELIGMSGTEMSQDQISYCNSLATSSYPNATLVGPSSSLYNCHSYAWYNNSQNNAIWLNDTVNNTFQLDKYWNSYGVYAPCSVSEADRIFYLCSGGDHSAIVENSNQVISKWGALPLMRHSISYCPYPTNNLQYYKFQPGDNCIRTPFANISGNSQFAINTQQTFSFPKSFPGLTTNWSVENIANPTNTSSFSAMMISGGLRLVCYEIGAYRVRVNFNYRGQDVSFSDMIVVARPY